MLAEQSCDSKVYCARERASAHCMIHSLIEYAQYGANHNGCTLEGLSCTSMARKNWKQAWVGIPHRGVNDPEPKRIEGNEEGDATLAKADVSKMGLASLDVIRKARQDLFEILWLTLDPTVRQSLNGTGRDGRRTLRNQFVRNDMNPTRKSVIRYRISFIATGSERARRKSGGCRWSSWQERSNDAHDVVCELQHIRHPLKLLPEHVILQLEVDRHGLCR
jgi:hypothetical protein